MDSLGWGGTGRCLEENIAAAERDSNGRERGSVAFREGSGADPLDRPFVAAPHDGARVADHPLTILGNDLPLLGNGMDRTAELRDRRAPPIIFRDSVPAVLREDPLGLDGWVLFHGRGSCKLGASGP